MHKTVVILCLLSTTLHCGMSSADEPSDALSARIDKRLQEKWPELWIGHDYLDRQVRKMQSRLPGISFPATDGTVARTLGIADPRFGVAIRECGFSLFSDDESGRTRTHEICRLNRDFELVVVRLTVFRVPGKAETTEISAVIRPIK